MMIVNAVTNQLDKKQPDYLAVKLPYSAHSNFNATSTVDNVEQYKHVQFLQSE